jgi:hypothetical protein
MKTRFVAALFSVLLISQTVSGAPRKGISYKPTQDGGRACYIDGVFAYEMPQVPKGLWGTTYGVPGTPLLKDGPIASADWKQFLESKGVRFGKGASATYYAAFGHLVVVNTREQQEVLTRLVTPAVPTESDAPTSPKGDPSPTRPQ